MVGLTTRQVIPGDFGLVTWLEEEVPTFDLRSLGFLLNSLNRLIILHTKAS